jgi:hypothetical protein
MLEAVSSLTLARSRGICPKKSTMPSRLSMRFRKGVFGSELLCLVQDDEMDMKVDIESMNSDLSGVFSHHCSWLRN